MTRITSSDVGKETLVRGVSLEGRPFQGFAEIQGIKEDLYGEAVAVNVNGTTQHFRQHDVSGIREGSGPQNVTGGQPGGCAVIPMLLAAGGAVAALVGAKYGVI